MPPEPFFHYDKFESLVRKCIVFPADGSGTCIVPMVVRTVTTEDDVSSLKLHSRCVDMASTFGDDYRKTQVMKYTTRAQITYLFFYNLSPNLPININIAECVIEVTPSHLKTKKRLFWRGDVVAMKVQPQPEPRVFHVESLDADISELDHLEEFLWDKYQEGYLERLPHFDEQDWNSYLAKYCGPTSLLFGAPKSYWGKNATEKEENYLHDLNELRCSIGRPPLLRPVYIKSYTECAVGLYATFKSAFGLRDKVSGPPKFPPELERQIFETCALENPEVCTVLVLVARRVYEWIDPFLIETVCITDDFGPKRQDRVERFLAKLTNGKPVDYYARHIKNLAIFGGILQTKLIDRILTICTGVERLVLLASVRSFDVQDDFFENHWEGRNLRRLSIKLKNVPRPFRSTPNFYHPCFPNLTHLHLCDESNELSTYAGWETLTNLTHLAFARSGPPEQVMQLLQTLPTVRYVAIGRYVDGEWYKYYDSRVNNTRHIRERWGVRVVFLSEIPEYDWERGARGTDDFWTLVEQEVQRRLDEESVDSVDLTLSREGFIVRA